MKRGKVGRSYGERRPEGEARGETGRLRAQSIHGRSRLLTASREKAAALPANESVTLVCPLMRRQWETRPHMQRAGKHSGTWPGVDSPAWGAPEGTESLT